MALIFLNWIYIFFTAKNFGIFFTKILNIQNCNVVILQVLGLFFYATITSIFAFFIRINIEYYIIILILNIFLAFKFKSRIKNELYSIVKSFNSFKTSYKLLYLFLFLIVLAQSATKPYLLDNESYYIQTIKWINEYGFVKGLANLHLFLGQNSTWHTLQAGFNFSFISNYFNDINGFLFVIMGFLFIEKLNEKHIQEYSLGLVLVFNLFFMQFINAPSPDLIIFLITPYICYLFIINFKKISINDFKIILSLVLFLCLVKVTMLVLALLVVFLFLKNYHVLKVCMFQYIILCTAVFGLFLSKNFIISGHLFYPTHIFDILNVDWKLPKELLQLYKTGTYQAGMDNTDVSHLSFFGKVKYWLQIPKLHGLFNKIYLLLIFIFPFFFAIKNKYKASLLVIYILAILQFFIVWLNSPQYRFYFVFIIILSIQIFTMLFKTHKIGTYLIYASVLLSAIPVFITIDLNAFTKNDFAMELNTFKFKNIVIPEENTKTETKFTKQNIDGFEFYSPSENVFFWATGNGDLPCVNKKQMEYIKYYYKYVPQMRTNNLKDGIKSVLIE
ncbi:MAG TPA: hypothetical protein VGA80_01475 [Flavobacteriaceae bacterium]